jgi:Cysteine rich repeat
MVRLNSSHVTTMLVGLLLSSLSTLAFAQQPSQAQASAIKQSCRADYQANCSSVPAGGRASLQCLQQHLSDLSPACQSAVNEASGGGSAHPPADASQTPPAEVPPAAMSPRQKAALMRRSCGADFHAYCQGVPLGGGRGLACLAANQSRLSPSCSSALAEARASR